MSFLNLIYTLRSYVESYLGFMRGTPFWSLIWVVAICAMVWLFGATLAFGTWRPLESVQSRLYVIGTVIVLWLLFVIIRAIRRRRAAKAAIDDLSGEEEIDPETSVREEVSELQTGLRDALIKMRQVSKSRFNFVYDLPWYLIIGSPGSGKTTTILNADLDFPLGDDVDGTAVRGFAGTRNCDWWFTEDAILIDTAGRYTTQDSDATVDSGSWQGFLQLLKKHRPLKPVNGIIIAISMENILNSSPQARIKEARIIRQRLMDLEKSLRVRIPVYLVFTKIDMIGGFSEFFDGFNRYNREQVLGTTFPLGVSQTKGKVGDVFAHEFDQILERVNRILMERMQQEPDDVRRSKVFRFPSQFGALKSALTEIVKELTAASKLAPSPLLRGVYFGSGTQSGQIIERNQTALSSRFSFLPGGLESGHVSNTPYFFYRLFKEVIFNEANLVTTDQKVRRRKIVLSAAAYLLVLGGVVGILTGWGHAWFTGNAAVASVNGRLAAYERDVQSLPLRDVQDADLRSLIDPLNQLRSALDTDIAGLDRWYHFGLHQEEKIKVPVESLYARGLNEMLLPRILVHLHTVMSDSDTQTSERYRSLKTYLMLGGAAPLLDQSFVEATMKAEFERVLPGDARAGQRRDLETHLSWLLATPGLRTLELDQQKVDAARALLRGESPARRTFEFIVGSAEAQSLPQWRVEDKAGSGAQLLLMRQSGQSMRDGIPGIYTRNGFYSVFLPALDRSTRDLIGETWVFGEDYLESASVSDLKQSVLREYLQRAQSQWSSLIGDLRIRQPQDLPEALNIALQMSSRDNAVLSLARAIGNDTNFREPPAQEPVADGNDGLNAAAEALETATTALQGAADTALTNIVDIDLLDSFGDPFMDPYALLRPHLTAQGEDPAPVEAIIPIFEKLYVELSNTLSRQSGGASRFAADSALLAANQILINEAGRQPAPLDGWIGVLASDIGRLTSSGARRSLSDLWQTTGGQFCRLAIENRYPFVEDAGNEVAIRDFIRMFGPSGEFATFFNSHLRPFVDTSQSPWRWTGPNGTDAIDSKALVQFERAEKIRQAFFSTGSLELELDITPVELDAQSTAVTLNVHDESITYDHGPVQTRSFSWPGDGNRTARISFQPPGSNAGFDRNGPWAMFRLFERAERKDVTDNRFELNFKLGGRSARFDIQTGSVLNPFTLSAISDFQCPAAL